MLGRKVLGGFPHSEKSPIFFILPNITPGRLREKRKVTEGQAILAWLLRPSVVLTTLGCYILLLRQTSPSETFMYPRGY